MIHRRPPSLRLRSFVRQLWAIEPESPDAAKRVVAPRERVLPTGAAHVAFRLSASPFRVYRDEANDPGTSVSHAVVGGARSGAYLRDAAEPACSVGALLVPGASEALLGAPADELAERHTPLDELWGGDARRALERLIEAASAEQRLAALEALLCERLPEVRGIHPAVAHALERFAAGPIPVADVARETGWSERRFLTLFRRAVGLSPKRFCRVLRFQRALARVASGPDTSFASLADVALDAGYSDQGHLAREFRAHAGVTPGEYRRLRPARAHHLPAPPPAR